MTHGHFFAWLGRFRDSGVSGQGFNGLLSVSRLGGPLPGFLSVCVQKLVQELPRLGFLQKGRSGQISMAGFLGLRQEGRAYVTRYAFTDQRFS